MHPPYVSYARMDELHRLAEPVTDSPRELTFILLSHVQELLFRMVYVEADQARTQVRQDQLVEAVRSLARAARTQGVLVACWESMNGMAVDEFLDFREILGEASGTQSFMYRTLEFALGNKDRRMVRQAGAHLDLYPGLRAELEAPSLYDETLRMLHRRGLAVPAQILDRDVREQYEPDKLIEDAWLTVYRDPAKYQDVYLFAEGLIEVAYQFSRWRATHLLVVERMLGSKHGSAGTEGVPWLRRISEHRFFPELWSSRTLL
jgi:tryptophan 2,3-dioxygenase